MQVEVITVCGEGTCTTYPILGPDASRANLSFRLKFHRTSIDKILSRLLGPDASRANLSFRLKFYRTSIDKIQHES